MIELTIKGSKAHIKNDPIKVSEVLNFQAVDSSKGLSIVKLSDIKSDYKIISSVPSLDTKTCALQTVRFNHEASTNLTNFVVVTISKDLPFAQTRFCQSLKVNQNFHVLSDYRNDSNNFANTTHLIVDETQLLARSIMIVDKEDKVLYQQIVHEVSSEPDYQAVIDFAKTLK